MAPVSLSVGISYSDRVAPMLDGSVTSPHLSLSFHFAPVDEIFWRGLHSSEFDLVEMSLAAHCVLASRGDRRFVGLPIFTSRIFRHGSVYVRGDSSIASPSELAGKRVGVPEYQMTAAVWMRGIFSERFGLDLRSVHWFAGGVDRPGRKDRIDLELPPGYELTRIPDSQTLSEMLLAGQLDALICAKMPKAFSDGSGRIRRLFADARGAEAHYYRETGCFPMMHLCLLRREHYERRPALAREIFDLFERAKETSLARLYDADFLAVMSPWLLYELEAAHSLLGRDYWPYGLEKNRRPLETFLRYMKEQGLLRRSMTLEDIVLAI